MGGSDDHKGGVDEGLFQSPIGDPTTMVYAETLSAAAILAGVRAGRTAVKLQGPGDPGLELGADVAAVGDTIAAESATLTAVVRGAPAGARVDSAVTVLVQDAYGNPVSGAGVSFATREGSGGVVPARTLTDSLGHARAVWTLGEARGVHGLVIRADSLPPLQLRATALLAPATPGLAPMRLSWTEYGVPVPGGGEASVPGVRPAPPAALDCWRNALGEVALEPGGCGE